MRAAVWLVLAACSAGEVTGPDASGPADQVGTPALVWEAGTRATSHVLHNTGAAPAPLDLFTATGGFSIAAIACDETLAPDAGCTVDVGIPPGAYAGALAVISDGETIATPLK